MGTAKSLFEGRRRLRVAPTSEVPLKYRRRILIRISIGGLAGLLVIGTQLASKNRI